MQLWTNNCQSTLSVAVTTNTQTSFTVQPGKGTLYPAPTGGDFFLLTLDDGNNIEIVKITSRPGNGDTLSCDTTINRGQENTIIQASFAIGTRADLRITANSLASLVTKDSAGRVGINTGNTTLNEMLTIKDIANGNTQQLKLSDLSNSTAFSYLGNKDNYTFLMGGGRYVNNAFIQDGSRACAAIAIYPDVDGSSISFWSASAPGITPTPKVWFSKDGNLMIGNYLIGLPSSGSLIMYEASKIPDGTGTVGTNGAGFGQIYVQGGALKYRAPGGHITTMGPIA